MSKIPFNSSKGFTILEITVVMAVIFILISSAWLLLSPVSLFSRSRDNKRISDLTALDRAVSEFYVDYGDYPDTASVLRKSNVLPAGATDLANAQNGWISQNLSEYTSKLPVDPINDATYNYQYIHNGSTYELNATLEYIFEVSQSDNGTSTIVYELGNNLSLISP